MLDHLIGTHELLQQWGNPPAICRAGLFHSIYGTRIYLHQSVALTQRRQVRVLIGREAEQLAYLFCILKRPRALIAAAKNQRLGKPCPTLLQQKGILGKLLEIECANLFEQQSNSNTALQIYRVACNNNGLISGAALSAIAPEDRAQLSA